MNSLKQADAFIDFCTCFIETSGAVSSDADSSMLQDFYVTGTLCQKILSKNTEFARGTTHGYINFTKYSCKLTYTHHTVKHFSYEYFIYI